MLINTHSIRCRHRGSSHVEDTQIWHHTHIYMWKVVNCLIYYCRCNTQNSRLYYWVSYKNKNSEIKRFIELCAYKQFIAAKSTECIKGTSVGLCECAHVCVCMCVTVSHYGKINVHRDKNVPALVSEDWQLLMWKHTKIESTLTFVRRV